METPPPGTTTPTATPSLSAAAVVFFGGSDNGNIGGGALFCQGNALSGVCSPFRRRGPPSLGSRPAQPRQLARRAGDGCALRGGRGARAGVPLGRPRKRRTRQEQSSFRRCCRCCR